MEFLQHLKVSIFYSRNKLTITLLSVTNFSFINSCKKLKIEGNQTSLYYSDYSVKYNLAYISLFYTLRFH